MNGWLLVGQYPAGSDRDLQRSHRLGVPALDLEWWRALACRALCHGNGPRHRESHFRILSIKEEPRAYEPHNLSDPDFMPERLAMLVRRAVENEEISLSRSAEILRMDLASMRDVAS